MKRDFTEESRQKLLELVRQVEAEQWWEWTDKLGDLWYGFEAWIGALDVRCYLDDLDRYHKKVIDKNNMAEKSIEEIFAKVNDVSNQYKNYFATLFAKMESYQDILERLTASLKPSVDGQPAAYDGTGLGDAIHDYQIGSKLFDKVITEGVSQEDLETLEAERELQWHG